MYELDYFVIFKASICNISLLSVIYSLCKQTTYVALILNHFDSKRLLTSTSLLDMLFSNIVVFVSICPAVILRSPDAPLSFNKRRRHSIAGQPPALASEPPGLAVCSHKACNETQRVGKEGGRKCQSTDGEL